MKTVSVVMPVYNGEKYLKEAIESILKQSYTDFEFIILNDGSTDKTEEIILSYDDPRIVYVKNENNLQIVETLNKGISLAKGKYIARMDADDISLSERLKKQVDFMDKNPEIGVCGSWVEYFGGQEGIWKTPQKDDEIKMSLFMGSPFSHPSVIIRRDLFSDKCSYSSEYPQAEDYYLWSVLAPRCQFHNIQEVLLRYRIHSCQLSKEQVSKMMEQHCLISYQYAYENNIDIDMCPKILIERSDCISMFRMVCLYIKFSLVFIRKGRMIGLTKVFLRTLKGMAVKCMTKN